MVVRSDSEDGPMMGVDELLSCAGKGTARKLGAAKCEELETEATAAS